MLTPANGLTEDEAKRQHERYGFNELPLKDQKTFLKTLAQVIAEPMFALLIVASFIYLLIGSLDDALLLLCFILLSIGITIYQSRKSERAIEALKDLSSPRALVMRDGTSKRISGREVVVGDLLILEEGDRIAADAKILESHDLLLDESLLTGESEPIEMRAEQIVHSGTLIVRGSGIAMVTAIGIHTEIGKIGKSLEQVNKTQSPLQIDTQILIKRFAIFGALLSLAVFIAYGFVYQDWLKGALTGISLTMALLPEEFTVILTVFMALGVWRISRQQVLTRHAPVIETLGSINTLCVDKTGTLTLNKMSLESLATLDQIIQLQKASIPPSNAHKDLLNYAVLASEINPFDPMEKAFHEMQGKLNPEDRASFENYTLVHEYGLSPTFPAMAHIWQTLSSDTNFIVAIKGSPETVMGLCTLSAPQQEIIEQQIIQMAATGLRILGVAKANHTKHQEEWPSTPSQFKFEWLGLVGLKDPLRPEVPEAIKQCQDAGIQVIMITGDHAKTAKAIAEQAGIDCKQSLSGPEINLLSDLELQQSVKNVSVFVRIKPEQKLRLVRALQANRNIVAMTGDGVNDAPALKAANVGIAMGQRGTDVAREASSLVLLNDDFSSIVNAIKQGRQIYDNLHKAIVYVIAVHIPIAGAVFIPLLLGKSPILSPIHILFLEMIIDPACAIVFEMENPESDLMHRQPRKISEKLLSVQNTSIAILQGLGLMAIVLALYLGLLRMDYSQKIASTIAFGSLALGNLLLIIVSRSSRLNFVQILAKPNPAQYWIIRITCTTFLILVFVPFLRERFQFAKIPMEGFAVILLSGVLGLAWCELVKYIYTNRMPN